MGKAKQFIDRKRAESYSLVYRNAEVGAESSDRQWAASSKGVSVGRPDADAVQDQVAPTRQAPWWLQDEVDDISEERRKELIELGFPDDGYDYLKHLRVLGKGQASLEGHTDSDIEKDAGVCTRSLIKAFTERHNNSSRQAVKLCTGPSTFVPALKTEKPAEDCKSFDARRLVLHQAAQDAVAKTVCV